MDRNVAFGRLLAIANVLGQRVFEQDKIGILDKHFTRFNKRPALTFEKIHKELMEYADKFDEYEIHLLDMFGDILSSIDDADFTNEPLNAKYLHAFHSQQHDLDSIIGVNDAAELWGLSPGYVKNLCAKGEVKAKKVGNTWVIDKNQDNPSAKEDNKMTQSKHYESVGDSLKGQEATKAYRAAQNHLNSADPDYMGNLKRLQDKIIKSLEEN